MATVFGHNTRPVSLRIDHPRVARAGAVSKSSIPDWMRPVLEFLVHCFFLGFGSSFIFLVGLESSLSSKLLLDTMSCFPHIGDQRITRGSDEPGTADRRLGKKASGPGACFLFPRRQLSLPLTISICTSLVVPQRQQTRRLAVVSRFTPYFWYYFCCSYFGSDGYMGSLAFSLFLFSHSKSRSGTVMSGVKDSA